jgi:hypothetical protein
MFRGRRRETARRTPLPFWLPRGGHASRQISLDHYWLAEAMSNLIYNQKRMLARQRKRLEIARQLNLKLKRKSARMLKVAKSSKKRG